MDTPSRHAADEGRSHEEIKGASTCGLWLFIAALSMLFAASLVGYLVIRFRTPEWPPAGMPPLPVGLFVSTFILILCSVTLHGALDSARKGRQSLLRLLLVGAFVLGILFLASQLLAWSKLLGAQVYAQVNLYAFTFYLLTGLHGVHVIGGLIPLAITVRKAYAGAYGPQWVLPVKHVGMYWHFLLIVWLIMFTVMEIAG
jgi:cytochrome c oxidase subunit 3